MGWTVDPVEQAVLFHYSEDPRISRFGPHAPRSNPDVVAVVWAIDEARAPLYWFPGDCPRVAVWANDAPQRRRLQQVFGTKAPRVHAAPSSWSAAIASCKLYGYWFDATGLDPWPDAEGQWISYRTVNPLEVAPAGDLLLRHRQENVELRLLPDLRAMRDTVLDSHLPFSIVRYPG